MNKQDELRQAAKELQEHTFCLGSWCCLDVPLADWLIATADRIGGKSWTGSREALRLARIINRRAK